MLRAFRGSQAGDSRLPVASVQQVQVAASVRGLELVVIRARRQFA